VTRISEGRESVTDGDIWGRPGTSTEEYIPKVRQSMRKIVG
jgi:hypothetical protein